MSQSYLSGGVPWQPTVRPAASPSLEVTCWPEGTSARLIYTRRHVAMHQTGQNISIIVHCRVQHTRSNQFFPQSPATDELMAHLTG